MSAAGKLAAVVMAFAFISYQDFLSSTTSWLRTADTLATIVSAYTEQTLTSSALVLRNVADSIREADIQSETELRQIAGGEPVFEQLRLLIKNEAQVDVASIIALDGTLLSYSRSYPPPKQNLGDRDYFAAALELPPGQVFLSDPVQNKTNGNWTFYLAMPLRTRSDNLVGVAIVGIQTRFFSDFYARTSFGEGSAITLFRDTGVVLARSRYPNDLTGAERPLENARAMLKEGPSPPAKILHAPGPASLTVATNRILAPRQLTQFPALVVIAIGEDLYLADWWRTNYIVGAAALVILLGIVLSARRTLRLLREQEQTREHEQDRRVLSAIVETPSALTAVLNERGEVVHANGRFKDAFKGVEIQGGDVLRSASVRGADELLKFAGDMSANARDFEIQIVEQGRKAFLHLSATRQFLVGLGNCVVLVGHDETERLQTQAALVQSAKLVTLGEMATGVAHELNQPLFVISMTAQNALAEVEAGRGGPAEPAGQEVQRLEAMVGRLAEKFGNIVVQVKRASAIIQNMRVFGRTADLDPVLFDVRDACRSALDLVREQVRVAGISVTERLGDEPLLVNGAQSTLEQVILNLIVNARDALKDSSVRPRAISIWAGRGSEGRVAIKVADNGAGIAAHIRERIFDPFFTTKPVGQGVGLGLSISYGIVRDMGGTLSLLAEAPGTTFLIDLPAAEI